MGNVVFGARQHHLTATKPWPNSHPQIPTPIQIVFLPLVWSSARWDNIVGLLAFDLACVPWYLASFHLQSVPNQQRISSSVFAVPVVESILCVSVALLQLWTKSLELPLRQSYHCVKALQMQFDWNVFVCKHGPKLMKLCPNCWNPTCRRFVRSPAYILPRYLWVASENTPTEPPLINFRYIM